MTLRDEISVSKFTNRKVHGVIDKITIRRVEFPLYQPYKLAFGNVHSYESLVVEVQSSEGGRGVSEATIVNGYTPESTDEAWKFLEANVRQLLRSSFEDSSKLLLSWHEKSPFAVSAVIIASEMAFGFIDLNDARSLRCPIVGLVEGKTNKEIQQSIAQRLEEGYEVLKFKVGFDLDMDVKRTILVQEVVDGRAMIRIDANQGYSVDEAVKFVSSLSPSGIELIEQTCAAGDWEAAKLVAKAARIPLMLDESIYDIEDVERAADLNCASYIKTKALKAGGFRKTSETIERIRKRGLVPVIGNGAAMDLSCLMEVLISGTAFETSGEMNGFLKTPVQLLETPLSFCAGSIVVPDQPVRINEACLRHYTQQKVEFF